MEGILLMNGQLMEYLVFNTNSLMASLTQLTDVSILMTVFVLVKVVGLPLLIDVTHHGENLENSYHYLHGKQFLETLVVRCITAVSEGRFFIHQNVGNSDKKIRNVWNVVNGQCSYECATSRKNNVSVKIPSYVELSKFQKKLKSL